MIDEHNKAFIEILKAVDGGDFNGWFATLPPQIHNGLTTGYFYLGKQAVSRELIMSVKESPEDYRKRLNTIT
jgi:hypothetical protein